MSKNRVYFVVTLFVSFLLWKKIDAFPSFPGSCDSVRPVGGLHVTRNLDGNGPTTAIYDLIVGGSTLLDSGTNVISVADGSVPFTIQPAAIGVPAFRGFLLRISGGDQSDLSTVLTSSESGAQVVSSCAPLAAGLGHTNRTPKQTMTGELNYQTEGSESIVTIELTLVPSNNAVDGSIWYHSSYIVELVGDEGEMTEPPSMEPSSEPIAAMSAEPSTEPSISAAPSFAPSSSSSPTMFVQPSPVCVDLNDVCQFNGDCCSNRCGSFDLSSPQPNGICLRPLPAEPKVTFATAEGLGGRGGELKSLLP